MDRAISETLPQTAADVWESDDSARLEVARATVGAVLRQADELFPFVDDAFRLSCTEGFAQLRTQGWPVAALVRGLALGDDDLTAGAALRHAALDRSTYLVLARALESDLRVEDALSVLELAAVDVGDSSSLVKALERISEPVPEAAARPAGEVVVALVRATGAEPGAEPAEGPSEGPGDADSGSVVRRRRAAVGILAAGTGPSVSHAWDRLAGRTASGIARSRNANWSAELLEEVAELWPPDVAVGLLEQVAGDGALHDASRKAFLARVERLGEASARRLDEALARRQQTPALLPWCVAASLHEIVPTLVRALEEGHEPEHLLPALAVLGGTDVAVGLHGLWRDAHSPRRASQFLDALTDLLRSDDTLARRFGAAVSLDGSDQLVDLAAALPVDARRGLLAGALTALQASGDRGGHRAALLVALGRTGSESDGQDLIQWIGSLPATDSLLPLAWAAAGRLAPDAAAQAWSDRIGDPRLLSDVVDVVSPRLDVDLQPSARTLAPLSAALAQAASRSLPNPETLQNSPNPSMDDLP